MRPMVKVSSPDKVMFPEAGLTKADLVGHYQRVADRMLPHLAGRPLTLHRFPAGINAKGFLQKNAADYFPASIERVEVPKREGGVTSYPVVGEPGDLAYLANQNTVTFHVWTSRLPVLEQPDRLIFDLDPADGDWDAARRAAPAVRAFLAGIGLPTAPMTTGSNGYHLVSSIEPEIHVDDLSDFARTVAALVARRHPDLLTDEFRIEKRKGRVYVDWLRNRFGQTGVAAWSLRARPEAPVAVPFRWDELDDTLPRRWTLATVAERLDAPDTIAELARVDAAPALAAVTALAEEAGLELEPFDRFRS